MEMIKRALDSKVKEENFKIIQSFESEVEPIFHEKSKMIWTRFAEVCACIPTWLERYLYPYLDMIVPWASVFFYGFLAIKVIIVLQKGFFVILHDPILLILISAWSICNLSYMEDPFLVTKVLSTESALLLYYKLSVFIFIGLLLYWPVKVFLGLLNLCLSTVMLWLGLAVVYISLCWCCAVYWSNTTLVILEIFQRFFNSDVNDSNLSQRNKAAAPSEKEYLFVDFNAWEFSASEELWTGLIRNLYEKVELRLSNKKIAATGMNWKEMWRIKKSIELLEKTYGGKLMLQLWCILLFLVGVLVVLLALGVTLTAIEDKNSNYDDIWAIFATAIPGCAWLKVFVDAIAAMNKVSDTSRGEFLFEESKSIRDRTGFMSDVRKELSDLFKFINEDFRETGIQLLLVRFIDDLDRVLEGRNVKMLEAVQLLLNVPGAPVFVFLAIDSRIVVASIEQQLNKQSNLKGVRITGWEYLEKFVQIPLSIPEVSPERIQYLLEKSLRVTINEEQLKSFLMKVVGHINKLITDNDCKNLQCRFDSGGTSFDVSALSLVSEWDKKNGSLLDSFIAIANVLKLRRSVNRNDKEQLEALYSDLHTTISNAKYVEIPVQPKQINPQPTRTTTVAPPPVIEVETPIIPTQRTEPVIPEAPISEKFFDAPLITDETSELLPANMADMMKEISRRVDCNPRGIKRLINLLQIIAEIGKIKPVTGKTPHVLIKDWNGGETWKSLTQKAVIWIFMAQSFSFRLSALVQILLDFEQKADFNVEDPSVKGYKYKMWTICEKDSKTIVPKIPEEEEKFDGMTIFHFYHTYVEKFIYVMPCSEKLLRVDKDPEDFAFLLKLSARFKLQCQDILGPKIDLKTDKADENSERVRDFSLLAYSFNLDPAMRLEVCYNDCETSLICWEFDNLLYNAFFSFTFRIVIGIFCSRAAE